MGAAILGRVRQTGRGIDVPNEFWQTCYYGGSRRRRVEKTFENMLSMNSSEEFDEILVGDAIRLAITERSGPAAELLFTLKAMCTKGNESGLKALPPLCWRNDTSLGVGIKLEPMMVGATVRLGVCVWFLAMSFICASTDKRTGVYDPSTSLIRSSIIVRQILLKSQNRW